MLLYIIRHADPIYNPDTLTTKGKLQASALAKRLVTSRIDKIYSSPSGRAIETAKYTADLLGKEINIEPWANEVAGEFSVVMPDGKKVFVPDIENTVYLSEDMIDLGKNWHSAKIFESIDAKNTYEKICSASDDFLARHGYKREGSVYKITKATNERVAVFCHGGLSAVWLSHLLNIPLHLVLAGIGINHTGVTIVDFENRESGITAPYCLCISDVSHLYKEGLPFKFTNYTEL